MIFLSYDKIGEFLEALTSIHVNRETIYYFTEENVDDVIDEIREKQELDIKKLNIKPSGHFGYDEQYIFINNLKIKLVYVASETPYYISEEPITQRIWNKVMDIYNDESWSKAIVDKTEEEWNIFLEKCRKMSHEPIRFATNIEIETAIEAGITQQPKFKTKKQRYWEKDVQSIQRHRRNAKKAQKWADLIGVQIKITDDPTLLQYSTQQNNNQPKWLVIR